MKKIVIIILFFSLSIISAVENLHMAFTGNMRGLLLPCNCSIPTGGLARRREYFHNQSDNHLLVDAGNIFFSAAPKTQTEMTNMMIISDYIACYYSDYLCYDVINVGEYDCLLGMDILLRYINNYELPFVSCNIFSKQGDLLFPAYRLIKRNGMLIAFTGFCHPHISGTLAILEPEKALTKVLSRIREHEPDIIICLADRSIQQIGDFHDKILESVDFFVCSRHPGANEIPLRPGGSSAVQIGNLGRNVGHLTLTSRDSSASWTDLSPRYHRAKFACRRLRELKSPKSPALPGSTEKEKNIKRYERISKDFRQRSENGKRYFIWRYEALTPDISENVAIRDTIEMILSSVK